MRTLSKALRGTSKQVLHSPAITLSRSMKVLLCYWYRMRFSKQTSTTALMETIDDPRDQKALGIVALLDVDSLTMRGLMDAEELQFVEVCHRYLREQHCEQG